MPGPVLASAASASNLCPLLYVWKRFALLARNLPVLPDLLLAGLCRCLESRSVEARFAGCSGGTLLYICSMLLCTTV